MNDGKDIAAEMSRFVNCCGSEHIQAFVDAMGLDHPTLQQSFSRLCVVWFRLLAKTEHFDLRNEASVKLARRIVGELEDSLALPMI